MSLRVFSYGGGVQSTGALVLAAQGRIDFPTFLFCNVGDDSEHPGTLLFAVVWPDEFDPGEVDPEQVADELVEILNEERHLNWPERGQANDLAVSAIPAAQWLTARTMRDLRVRESVRFGWWANRRKARRGGRGRG